MRLNGQNKSEHDFSSSCTSILMHLSILKLYIKKQLCLMLLTVLTSFEMCLLFLHVYGIFIWSDENLYKSMLRNRRVHWFRDINPNQFQIDRRISYMKKKSFFFGKFPPRIFFSNLKSFVNYFGILRAKYVQYIYLFFNSWKSSSPAINATCCV